MLQSTLWRFLLQQNVKHANLPMQMRLQKCSLFAKTQPAFAAEENFQFSGAHAIVVIVECAFVVLAQQTGGKHRCRKRTILKMKATSKFARVATCCQINFSELF